MNKVQRFANEAIYVLQLNTRDAVRYICRNAGCDEVTAVSEFKLAVAPYKK